MDKHIIRKLVCYSNESEELIFEVALCKFNLSEFQREFGVDLKNPMFDCYELKKAQIPFVSMYLPKTIDIDWNFGHYSFFIESLGTE